MDDRAAAGVSESEGDPSAAGDGVSAGVVSSSAPAPPLSSPPAASSPPLGPSTWPSWLGVGALSLLATLPNGARHLVARGATAVAMRVSGRERRRIDVNFRACFPELDAAGRLALERRYRVALFDAVLRMPLLWWGSAERLERNLVTHGKARLDEALAAGTPVVLLISHTVALDGGMIAMSPRYALQGFYKPFPNPVLDWLVRRSRTRFGGVPFARGNGFRAMIRGLQEGKILCYLSDEDLGREGSVFAPFFGHRKATLAMLPRIARKTGATVIPMATYLDHRSGAWEVHFDAPLAPYPSGDAVADAALMNAAIERSVRARPEQYLWKLALFRTCPDGGRSRYRRIETGELSPEEL